MPKMPALSASIWLIRASLTILTKLRAQIIDRNLNNWRIETAASKGVQLSIIKEL